MAASTAKRMDAIEEGLAKVIAKLFPPEEVAQPEVKKEPGSVISCCPDNVEHQIVRLVPLPGSQSSNIVGEGSLQVKSNTTGEYVGVFCCPFCNKRGK